jgi:ketosteroid isomerase-like protein
MTRPWWSLCLAASLLVPPAVMAATAPSNDPAATVDDFHFALKGGDRRKALSLLSENVLVFDQGRLEHSRSEYALKSLKEDMSFAALTKRNVARREVAQSRDLAWVLSVVRITGKINNRPIDLTTNETILLKREGGRWQITHIHWSFGSNKGGV